MGPGRRFQAVWWRFNGAVHRGASRFVAATACASRIALKQGMKASGPLSVTSLWQLVALICRVLVTPLLLIGYGLSAVRGLLWLVPLSRLDLSFAALLVNATFYVLLLVASALVLRETVTPWRRAGAALIVAGAMLVSRTG